MSLQGTDRQRQLDPVSHMQYNTTIRQTHLPYLVLMQNILHLCSYITSNVDSHNRESTKGNVIHAQYDLKCGWTQ